MVKRNRVVQCYRNDGTCCEVGCSDYVQIDLVKREKEKNIDDVFVLVSRESLDLVLNFVWYRGGDGYPVGYSIGGRRRRIKMHRLLKSAGEGEVVDHINRDKLDNRLENLRVCTYKENSYNTSRRNNKFKGVKKVGDQYSATISKDGERHTINNIASEQEAAKIYDMMAEQLFGEFAGKNYQS
ncbi:MAG: HNH endonuclease [Harvfovirus sp.]|uniref:HNH endonuclease n=1 Tax=Harvfovirus sp. TaxID=2487768 RepID=A0A3G5A3B8_9VIRU|nr:MAG: HNH endonuclease [Harvfovirus sp.]